MHSGVKARDFSELNNKIGSILLKQPVHEKLIIRTVGTAHKFNFHIPHFVQTEFEEILETCENKTLHSYWGLKR